MASFYEHPCGTVSTIAHIIQCVSAIIVIGITAWAVRDTKTLPVIFSLVIVCILQPLQPVKNNHLTKPGRPNSSPLRHKSEH